MGITNRNVKNLMHESETKLLPINFINADNEILSQELAPIETKKRKTLAYLI